MCSAPAYFVVLLASKKTPFETRHLYTSCDRRHLLRPQSYYTGLVPVFLPISRVSVFRLPQHRTITPQLKRERLSIASSCYRTNKPRISKGNNTLPTRRMATLGEDLLGTVNKLQDLVFNTIGNDSLDLPQIVSITTRSMRPKNPFYESFSHLTGRCWIAVFWQVFSLREHRRARLSSPRQWHCHTATSGFTAYQSPQ